MSTMQHRSGIFRLSLLLISLILLAQGSQLLTYNLKGASHTSPRTIVFGSDQNYPPYEYNSQGQPTGFNVELIRAIARVMGFTVEIRSGPWSEIREQLQTGQIDVATLIHSEERDRTVEFATPYIWIEPGLFIRKGDPLRSLHELPGRQVLVQQGDYMEEYLLSRGDVQIVPVTDPVDALRQLAAGKYDAALLSSKDQGLYFINQYNLNNLIMVEAGLPPLAYGFAVTEENTPLLNELNEGLAILKENGEYQKIYDQWLGLREGNALELMIKDYIWVPVGILLLIAGMLAWSRTLQQQVKARTAELRASEAIQRRRNVELTMLNRVISAASSTLDEEKVLQVLCGELALAMQLPRVTATLIPPGEPYAVVVAEYRNPGYPSSLGMKIPVDNPATALLIRHKQPLLIIDALNDPRLHDIHDEVWRLGIATMLLLPLVVRGRTIGSLGLDSASPRTYRDDDMNLLNSAAAAAGQALEAAQLYKELQERAEALEQTVARRTAELREALQQAQAADRAKSEFVSNVNHELRTPLTSLKLYLPLLEQAPPHKHDQYLTAIKRETERLQNLIENLLQISRIDLGHIRPEFESLQLEPLLTTLSADRQELFNHRGLELHTEIPTDLPPVPADPKLLEQVVTNLLTNAMNYTPPGGQVWLHADKTTIDGHRWITISVRDTGVGIAPEEQKLLFRRFQRGEASQQLDVPGTGLGLAICKEIVAMHYGRITLESAPGQGSTFTIWLPE